MYFPARAIHPRGRGACGYGFALPRETQIRSDGCKCSALAANANERGKRLLQSRQQPVSRKSHKCQLAQPRTNAAAAAAGQKSHQNEARHGYTFHDVFWTLINELAAG